MQFRNKCEVARIRISTSMSEAMVLCLKTVVSSLWVGGRLLSQAKELKYLVVLMTSERILEHEMNILQFGVASVMRVFYQTVLVELSWKAKLLIH